MNHGIAGKKTQKSYLGNYTTIIQDVFQFRLYHGNCITSGFTLEAAYEGLEDVFLLCCTMIKLCRISLRRTAAMCSAIGFRFATTFMVFTGKFTGFS
jgi:hypothetical protein